MDSLRGVPLYRHVQCWLYDKSSCRFCNAENRGWYGAAATTPACPHKLVWDGARDTHYLSMAGNHDLSTAWTKYKDRAYGDEATAKMTQTCWDVEGIFIDK